MAQTLPSDLPDLDVVSGWVRSLRDITDNVTAALAQACAKDGALVPEALDQQQLPNFELAWATAELLAAESGLRAMASHDDDLNTRLVLIYTAEALISIRDRLDGIMLELGLPDNELHALLMQPEVKAFRKAVSGTDFLQ